MTLDLAAGKLRAGDIACDVSLPKSAREAFLSGRWDALGLLLERYQEVEKVAARLPYVSGF